MIQFAEAGIPPLGMPSWSAVIGSNVSVCILLLRWLVEDLCVPFVQSGCQRAPAVRGSHVVNRRRQRAALDVNEDCHPHRSARGSAIWNTSRSSAMAASL